MPRVRTWEESDLRTVVQKASSYRQVIILLGLVPAGGNYVHVARIIAELGLDTSHFTGKGWKKGKDFGPSPTQPLSAILVKGSTFQSYKLKKRLFYEGIKKQACELCNWAVRSSDGRIPLELDHINGDRTDNRIENLRVLCPNCHSLQPTHRGRNKRSRGGETGRHATLKML